MAIEIAFLSVLNSKCWTKPVYVHLNIAIVYFVYNARLFYEVAQIVSFL